MHCSPKSRSANQKVDRVARGDGGGGRKGHLLLLCSRNGARIRPLGVCELECDWVHTHKAVYDE